jgi:hypothetical protein
MTVYQGTGYVAISIPLRGSSCLSLLIWPIWELSGTDIECWKHPTLWIMDLLYRQVADTFFERNFIFVGFRLPPACGWTS